MASCSRASMYVDVSSHYRQIMDRWSCKWQGNHDVFRLCSQCTHQLSSCSCRGIHHRYPFISIHIARQYRM